MYDCILAAFLQRVALRIGTYPDRSRQGKHRVVQNCSEPGPAAPHGHRAVSFSYHAFAKKVSVTMQKQS